MALYVGVPVYVRMQWRNLRMQLLTCFFSSLAGGLPLEAEAASERPRAALAALAHPVGGQQQRVQPFAEHQQTGQPEDETAAREREARGRAAPAARTRRVQRQQSAQLPPAAAASLRAAAAGDANCARPPLVAQLPLRRAFGPPADGARRCAPRELRVSLCCRRADAPTRLFLRTSSLMLSQPSLHSVPIQSNPFHSIPFHPRITR